MMRRLSACIEGDRHGGERLRGDTRSVVQYGRRTERRCWCDSDQIVFYMDLRKECITNKSRKSN